jgi:serine/threonine-protein kinase RsbW
MTRSITVNCSTYNLKEIRSFISLSLDGLNLDSNDSNLIILAVDEVCSNRIIHSNNCDHKENLTVDISLTRDENGIYFEIRDSGIPFNINEYAEPSIDDIIKNRVKGSLGLILVRKIMDRIDFEVKNSINICRLFKRVAL